MATCEACRTLPPVIIEGYEPKGSWTTVGKWKVYTTGPSSATKVIIDIYDIFAMASQTLQGADLLAAALPNTKVLIPDWFEGEAMKEEWMTNPTPENELAKKAFYTKHIKFEKYVQDLRSFIALFKEQYPNVDSWGALGLCFGGKIVALSSGEDTLFKATAQVHPGRLDAADAQRITIPHMVLASDGEDPSVVSAYRAILVTHEKPQNVVDLYAGMHHGWMGARAKLDSEVHLGEYIRGYKQVADFFGKYL